MDACLWSRRQGNRLRYAEESILAQSKHSSLCSRKIVIVGSKYLCNSVFVNNNNNNISNNNRANLEHFLVANGSLHPSILEFEGLTAMIRVVVVFQGTLASSQAFITSETFDSLR